MIDKLKNIAGTDLIKTSFFTSIATLVKIATAFVLNKIVAVYVGPAGVALVGQFTNFSGIITSIGSGGIGTGIVKYIAENRKKEAEINKIISTSFILMLFCSVIASIVLLVFSEFFSNLIFKSDDYKFVITLLSFSLVFTSLNTLLLSVLNGLKEVRKYTWSGISGNLLMLIISIALVIKYKLSGVLIAFVAGQSLVFCVTLFFVARSKWFSIQKFLTHFDKQVLRNLSGFSLMTLVSSFTTPVALIIIRNYIGKNLSWDDAGYWQGVYSISEVYLMFITSSLSVYYLPRLSEISNPNELRDEIFKTSKIIFPVISVMALLVFLFKIQIVNILFTGEFTPMLPLFKFQLLGDVVKIACWLISYQMLSKAMTKLFIFTEVFFNLTFVLLTILFINQFGLEGSAIAFCANYTLYFIFLLICFRKQFFTR